MKRTAIILLAAALTTNIVATAADALQPGLAGRYYQMPSPLDDFPRIPEGQKPTIDRVDKEINFVNKLSAWKCLERAGKIDLLIHAVAG